MNRAYQEAPIVGGSVSLDTGSASVFVINMSENIYSMAISGATAGMLCEVDVLFYQGAQGGKTSMLPTGSKLPVGVKDLIEIGPYRVTVTKFSSIDGGATWIVEKHGSYDGRIGRAFTLPVISGENSTFNDECNNSSGWSLLNASLSSVGGKLSYTKMALGLSYATKPVSMPPMTSDSITYVKLSATCSLTAVSVIQFYDPATGRNAGVWIGSASASTSPAKGCVSIVGTTENGKVRNVAIAATGLNYDIDSLDMAIHWDSAFSTLNLYFREEDGRWKFKARVLCEFVSSPLIYAQFTPLSPAGSLMQIEHITICRPNIMATGDSICAGATLFNPNPSSGLVNDESTWMRHAPIYPGLRNNLIVQRGIPGNNSGQILSRSWSVKASSPQLVIFHASTNDALQGVSKSSHKLTIQMTANYLAPALVVILNQIYGTSNSAGNTPSPVLRDYGREAWTDLLSLTGVSAFIDIMEALDDGDGFIHPSKAQADGHPNIAGYKAIGSLISS